MGSVTAKGGIDKFANQVSKPNEDAALLNCGTAIFSDFLKILYVASDEDLGTH